MRAATGQDNSLVLRCYTLALEQYQKAYTIREFYYPGINVATLHFLLNHQQAAHAVLEGLAKQPTNPSLCLVFLLSSVTLLLNIIVVVSL